MKVPLEHFLQYLEKEERVHRAVGGLTTALGSIIKALDYDLSMFARAQKANVAMLEPQKMPNSSKNGLGPKFARKWC